MPKTIYLVDDDRAILTTLSMLLEENGYQSLQFTDGFSFWQTFEKKRPDLVLLDIKMPGMTGIEVLKKIRHISQVPVIFVTSKDEEADELNGLFLGADDYVKKPFSPSLLLARIQAVFRRFENASVQPALIRGDLKLEKENQLCFWKGKPVLLTVTEFLIVECLAQRTGVIKTRENLIQAAYGNNGYVDDRTIDSHMKRIRHKFKQQDPEFNQIESLYGMGYRLK
jgi:two-component system, OmpR family, response regulator ChvI